jgi:hypothetical protein
MSQKRLKAIRVPGFDLEESLYDAVDVFRQREKRTWRSIFQEALQQLVDKNSPAPAVDIITQSGGAEEV